ncbi:hypothetical protein [Saccharothrix sp. NRRL B-16314]|uniref:hypothetical protein n=1 Tax=Saccharothrix sp. NRRL B-16314 TaxID=1463825 RepID=UPI0012DCFDAA|nr:hypothetical protein [Saccharothrix sp. NRRL B-16314]
MRNVKVAVALALLALAGCSTTTSAPPGTSASTTASSATSATSPSGSTTLSPPSGETSGETQPPQPPPQTSAAPLSGGPTEVQAERIDGGTLPDHYKRQAWTSEDGRTVQVVGIAGGCKTASAEITAQSGDQVLITLVTTYYEPPKGGMCTQELRDVPLNVTLDAPLGSRRLVLEAREDRA